MYIIISQQYIFFDAFIVIDHFFFLLLKYCNINDIIIKEFFIMERLLEMLIES